jgi:hypothetical protein
LLNRDIEEAMITATTIAAWQGDGAQGRHARVTALRELGREEEALAENLRALEEFPGDATLASSAALIALRLGKFTLGWALHEYRLDVPGATSGLVSGQERLTRDDDLRHAQVLVHAEQGIGDAIQFIR